jgi:hypothetical protein
LRIDAPAGSSLGLAVAVTDTVGQETVSDEVTVPVIADPETTAIGRVVDHDGAPLAGAEVECLGAGGFTAIDGAFTVAGVPTASGVVFCSIHAEAPDGSTLSLLSLGVPPVPGGITDLGVLTVGPPMLYGGSDRFAFEPGILEVFSADLGFETTVGRPVEVGIDGLAFTPDGRLFATTLAGPTAPAPAGCSRSTPAPAR